MYASALNVVEQCEAWVGSLAVEASSMAAFYPVKGELLELARCQVSGSAPAAFACIPNLI